MSRVTQFFQRFPVASVQGVLVPLLIAVAPVFGWPDRAVDAVDVALVALGGVVAGFGVSVDAGLPRLVGLLQAVLAAVVVFGANIPQSWQTVGLAVVSAVAAAWTHTQVTAKRPAPVLFPLPRTSVEDGHAA